MNTIKQEDDVIKTDILKIRNNTLLFLNTIYQISNISEIRAIDLSTEKEMPQFYWLFLIAGIVLIAIQQQVTIPLGIISSIIFLYLIIKHYKNNVNEKYGLYISLNSGKSTIIASKNIDFVKNIAITIHHVMNNKTGAVNFDFSTNTINEVDFNEINASNGSVVNTGKVEGDITTSIK